MLGLSGHQVTNAPIASGNIRTDAFCVAGVNHVSFEMPVFGTLLAETTCNVYCEVAQKASHTFRKVYDEGNYSAGAGIAAWEVPSSEGNWNVICRPATRFDYIQVLLSTVATDGISCTIHRHY